MSSYVPSRLYLNDISAVQSHPACEWWCTWWALFELLTYLHEILSRLWVAMHLQSSIWITWMFLWNFIKFVSGCALPGLYWITDMFLLNPIQHVSGYASSRLYLKDWHAFIKFYQVCEWLCISRALFESLTCFYWILSSLWVAVHFQSSTWITNMSLLNYIQPVSGCAPPRLYLNH